MQPVVSTGLVVRANKVYLDWIEISIYHHTSINEAYNCNLLYLKYGPEDDLRYGSEDVAIYCKDLIVVLINSCVNGNYIKIGNNVKHNWLSKIKFVLRVFTRMLVNAV